MRVSISTDTLLPLTRVVSANGCSIAGSRLGESCASPRATGRTAADKAAPVASASRLVRTKPPRRSPIRGHARCYRLDRGSWLAFSQGATKLQVLGRTAELPLSQKESGTLAADNPNFPIDRPMPPPCGFWRISVSDQPQVQSPGGLRFRRPVPTVGQGIHLETIHHVLRTSHYRSSHVGGLGHGGTEPCHDQDCSHHRLFVGPRQIGRAALRCPGLECGRDDAQPDPGLADEHPARILVEALDVADPASIDAAVQAGIGRFGGLDAVVNNAGFSFVSIFETTSGGAVRRIFETNVFGVINNPAIRTAQFDSAPPSRRSERPRPVPPIGQQVASAIDGCGRGERRRTHRIGSPVRGRRDSAWFGRSLPRPRPGRPVSGQRESENGCRGGRRRPRCRARRAGRRRAAGGAERHRFARAARQHDLLDAEPRHPDPRDRGSVGPGPGRTGRPVATLCANARSSRIWASPALSGMSAPWPIMASPHAASSRKRRRASARLQLARSCAPALPPPQHGEPGRGEQQQRRAVAHQVAASVPVCGSSSSSALRPSPGAAPSPAGPPNRRRSPSRAAG